MHETTALPKTVDPFRYAASGRQLSGEISVHEMPRLLPDLLSDQSIVHVELTFGVDESIRLPWLGGKLTTCVELRCQRCLESFSYDIIAGFLLGLVRSIDAAENLPSRYDPVIVTDGVLVLKEVIEEELIVSLPVVPRHPPEICKAKIPAGQPRPLGKNPFEAIGVLRAKAQTPENK